MKRVPFKCKFGHVTIKEFKDGESTSSIIVCEKCKSETTLKILKYEHPYNDNEYIHKWPSNKLLTKYKPEMAVRI